MKKPSVIVVVGPTASGKTALGVKLAKEYCGEVVSADSMQIYKGMDIATAKPTKEEMDGVPHHLIDFLDREKSFSVADYVKLANQKISDIIKRGKTPIIVGGTGLYISSLLDNIQFAEIKGSTEIRERLEREAEQYGNEALLERLKNIDSETAEILHANNLSRVIRALEVFEVTGKKMSEYKAESRKNGTQYNACILGLTFFDREMLYNRINRRVDIMVENGLLEEASQVYEHEKMCGMATAHQAIGYKELIPYFENKSDLEECIGKIKQETRRYAKRQLTWFRKNEQIQWLMLDKFDVETEILEKSKIFIANSGIM